MTSTNSPEERIASLEARLAEADRRIGEANRRQAVQEEKLSLFQEIGLALASTLNLDPLLDRIVEHVTELLNAERCTLFILDQTRQELWAKIRPAGEESELRVRVGEGIAGLVAQTGRSLNLKDAYRHPHFSSRYDELTGYRTRSMLCNPLINYEKQIIGVIQVLNSKDGHFGVDDEKLLEAVAAQAAMSVENSKLYLEAVGKNIELLDTQERLRRKMDELDILFRIEQQITSTRDLEEILTGIVRNAVGAVPAEVGALALSEGEHESVTLCRVRARDAERHQLDAGEGIIGRVARVGRARVENGLEQKPDLARVVGDRLNQAPSSVACVPLIIKGESVGALAMYNKTGGTRYFTPDDLKLLTLIAGQTAKAIQRAREHEQELTANRLATVGQLLSGVLHDFRTPMSIINGYAQLMAGEEDPEEREEYSASVQKQIRLIEQMTREILAFAKGERNLLVRKVQLNKLLDEVAELLRGEFAGRNVDLVLEPGYRGVFWADEVKLQRVIFNLARNAREAMPDGGTFAIRVEDAPETDEVVFSFTDTGVGVPEEVRDKLFASFTTSGKKDGTGLGLAVVKRIVDEHQGAISFTSERGVGTTFVIRMPRTSLQRDESTEDEAETAVAS